MPALELLPLNLRGSNSNAGKVYQAWSTPCVWGNAYKWSTAEFMSLNWLIIFQAAIDIYMYLLKLSDKAEAYQSPSRSVSSVSYLCTKYLGWPIQTATLAVHKCGHMLLGYIYTFIGINNHLNRMFFIMCPMKNRHLTQVYLASISYRAHIVRI